MKRYSIVDKLMEEDLKGISKAMLEYVSIDLDKYFDNFIDKRENPFPSIWKFLTNVFDLNPKYDALYLYLFKNNHQPLNIYNDISNVEAGLFNAMVESVTYKDAFYSKDAFYNVYYTLQYLIEFPNFISMEKLIDNYSQRKEIDLFNSIPYCLENINKLQIPLNLKEVILKENSSYKVSSFCQELIVSIVSSYSMLPWYNLSKNYKSRFSFQNMYKFLEPFEKIEIPYLMEKVSGTALAAKIFGISINDDLKNQLSPEVLSYLANAILLFPNQYGRLLILDYIFEPYLSDSKHITEKDLFVIEDSIRYIFSTHNIATKYFNISISLLYLVIKNYLIKDKSQFNDVLKQARDDLQQFIKKEFDVPKGIFISDNHINYARERRYLGNHKIINSNDTCFANLQKSIIRNIYNMYEGSRIDIKCESEILFKTNLKP